MNTRQQVPDPVCELSRHSHCCHPCDLRNSDDIEAELPVLFFRPIDGRLKITCSAPLHDSVPVSGHDPASENYAAEGGCRVVFNPRTRPIVNYPPLLLILPVLRFCEKAVGCHAEPTHSPLFGDWKRISFSLTTPIFSKVAAWIQVHSLSVSTRILGIRTALARLVWFSILQVMWNVPIPLYYQWQCRFSTSAQLIFEGRDGRNWRFSLWEVQRRTSACLSVRTIRVRMCTVRG
jgi:hypothetical protein